ncbi:polysaccharide pyruvyl transferase family protein [Hafnia alvei]|uniref:polysaccharide pyruvyl transferase family protein n=1 Tax=Hafnia alvei TaxID=569 RepID=UPI000E05027A|nr:polysaccharide pyruvyl transferase family protein [Hafnia alvei]STQ68670.1 Polysaccharide pyruvyl transferase [Hafnia alvei]
MKMARNVGIINFQYSDHNYGAVLQAAALENFLNSKGIKALHIDYVSEPIETKQDILSVMKYVFRKTGLTVILKKLLGKPIIIKHAIRNEKVFEDFRHKWVQRTQRFKCVDELSNTELCFDAVIVGSDQVWRPKMFTRLCDYKVYFLSFLPDSVTRISYAASFGVDNWEIESSNITNDIRSYISKFSAVSVRESSGKNICKDVFDADAEVVLDPTLLIGSDFFEQIIKKEHSDDLELKEIVYYKLDVDDEFLKNITKLGHVLSKSVTNIYYNKTKSGYEYYSVSDWLNNIKKSEIIVTDSFHCVCFSILFKKEFLCCVNESRGLSRLQSLLSLLNINDRICFSSEDFSTKLNSLEPIDYENVEQHLLRLRESSERFLMNSLLLDSI